MRTISKQLAAAATAITGLLAITAVRAEPTDYEWSSTSGFISSRNKDAIETITGQAAFPVATPQGTFWVLQGNMGGTFTYDPDQVISTDWRPNALAYKGPNIEWSSSLSAMGTHVGTYASAVGEVIVGNGDGAPGGTEDLVNVHGCGAPCGEGESAFAVGPWQATGSSVIWRGEGFTEDDSLPVLLPPAGAPPTLGLFTFFNAATGANVNIISTNVDVHVAIQSVAIDVKPGSDPNCFNINGRGVVPVAILGSESFDIFAVDQSTLSFGGLQVRVRGNSNPQCSVEYSDGDEYLDLVCHFEDDSSAWVEGADEATLTGEMFDGSRFAGSDTICLVP